MTSVRPTHYLPALAFDGERQQVLVWVWMHAWILGLRAAPSGVGGFLPVWLLRLSVRALSGLEGAPRRLISEGVAQLPPPPLAA